MEMFASGKNTGLYLFHYFTANVGLAVGLSVGLFIFFCIGVPSFICILVFCVVYNQRRRPTIQTRVVSTMPSTGATTVVSSNQNTSFSTSAPVAAPYPTQQPVYKGAQFSSQDAPPPYDDATGKIPSEMQVCTQDVL